MSFPPLVLAAALALWGVRSAAVPYAAAMALVLEAAPLLPWRWQLGYRDFDRVADLSTLGFVVIVVYLFDAHGVHGIFYVMEWLPFVLFPLTAVQVYSTHRAVKYRSMFLSVRRAYARGLVDGEGGVDMRVPFFAVCLLAATGGVQDARWLVPALALILCWVLWHNRPRSQDRRIAMLLVASTVVAGLALQLGMLALRAALEPVVIHWFQDRVWSHYDPFRAYTAIGDVGRLKRSDRIVLRVTPHGDPRAVPRLLRMGTYQTFSRNLWLAGNATFRELGSAGEGLVWRYAPAPAHARSVTIAAYLPRGRGVLPVPNGTFALTHLPVEELERNPLGAWRVPRGPGFVEYTAHYASDESYELPPTEADLHVPVNLRSLMRRVLAQAGATAAMSPARVVRVLAAFFRTHFTYSLVLRRQSAASTPLQDFLLHTRAGHCEYFATAGVLLLRAAGVPARYATGFSVQEWSPQERRYLVRSRHAHAWVLAWLGGRWRDVDFTPPVWGAFQTDDTPWWQPVYDGASWLYYHYARWRWAPADERQGSGLLWLLVPLVAVLGWRLARSTRVKNAPAGRAVRASALRPGADSEFYLVESNLARAGIHRPPSLPVRRWLLAGDGGAFPGAIELAQRVLPLHYRYRFDPRGLTPQQRLALRDESLAWLAHHRPGAIGGHDA